MLANIPVVPLAWAPWTKPFGAGSVAQGKDPRAAADLGDQSRRNLTAVDRVRRRFVHQISIHAKNTANLASRIDLEAWPTAQSCITLDRWLDTLGAR